MSVETGAVRRITVDEVRVARARAGESGLSWVHVLQDQTGLDETGFLAALSAFACMTPMSSVDNGPDQMANILFLVR